MTKQYSPMVQKLINYGNNCIILLKENDKKGAKTALHSIISNINDYHKVSLYAIQYDIYNYVKHMPKHRFINSSITDTDINSEPVLNLKIRKNIKLPSNNILNSTEDTEEYINDLIQYTKDFEKELCTIRNNYIKTNANSLQSIGCSSYNSLESYIKQLITIN